MTGKEILEMTADVEGVDVIDNSGIVGSGSLFVLKSDDFVFVVVSLSG